jgi:hypothetical protein
MHSANSCTAFPVQNVAASLPLAVQKHSYASLLILTQEQGKVHVLSGIRIVIVLLLTAGTLRDHAYCAAPALTRPARQKS